MDDYLKYQCDYYYKEPYHCHHCDEYYIDKCDCNQFILFFRNKIYIFKNLFKKKDPRNAF